MKERLTVVSDSRRSLSRGVLQSKLCCVWKRARCRDERSGRVVVWLYRSFGARNVISLPSREFPANRVVSESGAFHVNEGVYIT